MKTITDVIRMLETGVLPFMCPECRPHVERVMADIMTTPFLAVTLTRPPSLNHYWRFTSRPFPHWYVAPKGVAWRTEAGWILKSAMVGRPPLAGFIAVTAHLCYAGQIDLDNIAKILLDAGTKAGVWKNDNQVTRLILSKERVAHRKDERLDIEIRSL